MKSLIRRLGVFAGSIIISLQLGLTIVAGISFASAGNARDAKAVALTRAQGPGLAVITIAVDATEAPRKILHARLTIPVRSGPLTLCYP